MELDKLSNQYMVHRLDSTEIESVFMLCSKNFYIMNIARHLLREKA